MPYLLFLKKRPKQNCRLLQIMGGALWLTSININNCNTSCLIDRFSRYLQIASLNKMIAIGTFIVVWVLKWEQLMLQATKNFIKTYRENSKKY